MEDTKEVQGNNDEIGQGVNTGGEGARGKGNPEAGGTLSGHEVEATRAVGNHEAEGDVEGGEDAGKGPGGDGKEGAKRDCGGGEP